MTRRAASIFILALAASGARGQVPLRVVVLSGGEAPGCPLTQFDVPGPLVLDSAGGSAMGGQLRGAAMPPAERRGVWASSTNGPILVARSGFPAPGTPDLFAPAFGAPSARAGYLAFAGWTLLAPRPGIWAGPSGAPRLIALAGAAAPGTDGVFSGFALTVPLINVHGQTAMVADLAGVPAGTASGVWACWSSQPELVVRQGDTVPGVEFAAKFASFDAPVLTDAPALALRARLVGPFIGPSNDEMVLLATPGAIAPVYAEGGPAPGLPGSRLGSPVGASAAALGDASIIVIPASTLGTSNGAALFAADSATGELRVLARAGEPFPGLNAAFASFDASTRITDAGLVVAQARLAGPAGRDAAIITAHARLPDRRVLVRKGDAPPARAGLPPGTTFGELTLSAADRRGRVLFLASMNFPAGPRTALWAHVPARGLLLLAFTGGDVRIGPDDFRPAELIGLGGVSGGGDGRPSPLSDQGEAAAFLQFADGTSAVVAFDLSSMADHNHDRQVDLFDYLDFVADFAAEAPAADVNGDNQVDHFDYLDFAEAFAAAR